MCARVCRIRFTINAANYTELPQKRQEKAAATAAALEKELYSNCFFNSTNVSVPNCATNARTRGQSRKECPKKGKASPQRGVGPVSAVPSMRAMAQKILAPSPRFGGGVSGLLSPKGHLPCTHSEVRNGFRCDSFLVSTCTHSSLCCACTLQFTVYVYFCNSALCAQLKARVPLLRRGGRAFHTLYGRQNRTVQTVLRRLAVPYNDPAPPLRTLMPH